MPHLCMEYSANLADRVDLADLCSRLNATLLDTGFFEPGAIRVRTLRCDHYSVADELPDNAFLDASLGYGANEVTLTLTRNLTELADVAATRNQRAAAAGVDGLGYGDDLYGGIG